MDPSRLTSVPLFASVSPNDRRIVARCADEIDLPEGRHLVDEGEFAYELFLIESGTAEVDGDAHVADLGPGDILGEMGVMGRAKRNASVVATSPVTVIVMTAHEFRHIARDMPAVAEHIQRSIEERSGALTG